MRLCMRLDPFHAPLVTVLIIVPALTAQSRWREIGKTSTGNSVYVDPASVKKDKGIITARIRDKFATPVAVQNGQQWAVSHHIAMFDCAKSAVAAKETVYYSDVAATKVVQRSTIVKP